MLQYHACRCLRFAHGGALFAMYLLYSRYFQNLVSTFEAKMELYRQQIEELESHLSAASLETGISSQSQLRGIKS